MIKFDELRRFYNENYSLGYINNSHNLADRLALISLICYVTYKSKLKNPDTTHYMIIMKIRGVDTIEDADKLRNKVLYMNRNDVELENGAYFIQDLIGLDVIDDDTDERLGRLDDVSETGANDVYHVKTDDGKVFLIPVIPDVIKEISPENGYVRIFKMRGLFD